MPRDPEPGGGGSAGVPLRSGLPRRPGTSSSEGARTPRKPGLTGIDNGSPVVPYLRRTFTGASPPGPCGNDSGSTLPWAMIAFGCKQPQPMFLDTLPGGSNILIK